MKVLIRSGVWPKGKKMPTERELMKQFGISRATASAAYKELLQEGYIIRRQGKGTFVIYDDEETREANINAERKPIDGFVEDTLDRVKQLGVPYERFVKILANKALQRQQLAREVFLCFVECNLEQLDYFARSIELDSQVKVYPMLIDELQKGTPLAKDILTKTDVMVTTHFHLGEVKNMVRNLEVIGIALDPSIETIAQVGRFPKNSSLLLVCGSTAFEKRVRLTLFKAGFNDLHITSTTTCDNNKFKHLLKKYNYVIASPLRVQEVKQFCKPDTVIVELVYKPDSSSLHLLNKLVSELRSGQALRNIVI